MSVTKEWECPDCGYIWHGYAAPDECPACGEHGSLFEPCTLVDDDWDDEPADEKDESWGKELEEDDPLESLEPVESWDSLALVDDTDLADRF